MTINEMHVAFRTIAQQMGMHLYRAILPESIDLYLNFAIRDLTQSIINQNVSEAYRDKVTFQDNKISPVNSLRTLVKNKVLSPSSDFTITNDGTNRYVCNINLNPSTLNSPMFYTSFSINIDNNFIPCRFVELDNLGDILNDYCNRPTNSQPIIVLTENTDSNVKFDIYLGKGGETIKDLIVTYLKHPHEVKYNAVNCNLPEHLHNKIVELAVTKYVQSVNLTAQTIKEQK